MSVPLTYIWPCLSRLYMRTSHVYTSAPLMSICPPPSHPYVRATRVYTSAPRTSICPCSSRLYGRASHVYIRAPLTSIRPRPSCLYVRPPPHVQMFAPLYKSDKSGVGRMGHSTFKHIVFIRTTPPSPPAYRLSYVNTDNAEQNFQASTKRIR